MQRKGQLTVDPKSEWHHGHAPLIICGRGFSSKVACLMFEADDSPAVPRPPRLSGVAWNILGKFRRCMRYRGRKMISRNEGSRNLPQNLYMYWYSRGLLKEDPNFLSLLADKKDVKHIYLIQNMALTHSAYIFCVMPDQYITLMKFITIVFFSVDFDSTCRRGIYWAKGLVQCIFYSNFSLFSSWDEAPARCMEIDSRILDSGSYLLLPAKMHLRNFVSIEHE